MRIVYVNGRYVPQAQARVHVQDRGYQFADGVYEVCRVRNGFLLQEQEHLDRLWRSLEAIRLSSPVSQRVLRHILGEVMRRNGLQEGIAYFQITRGSAPRHHTFPHTTAPRSSLVVALWPLPEPLKAAQVITLPDIRWGRCDIKSISLLPNVLARQQAKEKGAQEAWFVDERGRITEGAASNAWIISSSGVLITPPASEAILDGVVRRLLLRVARAHMEVEERPFTPQEAYEAREAFFSASSCFLMPVVRIDGNLVGSGAPGEITLKLRSLCEEDG